MLTNLTNILQGLNDNQLTALISLAQQFRDNKPADPVSAGEFFDGFPDQVIESPEIGSSAVSDDGVAFMSPFDGVSALEFHQTIGIGDGSGNSVTADVSDIETASEAEAAIKQQFENDGLAIEEVEVTDSAIDVQYVGSAPGSYFEDVAG